MATLTDLISKAIGALPEDSGEAKALLAEAKREASNLYDDLHSANAESKSRKEKIRELQSELESKGDVAETEKKLKAEIERLRKVESEHQSYLKQQDDKVLNTWAEKAKLFDIPKEDKRHDKIQAVKTKFVFPGEGQELTAEQARMNLDKFGLLEATGMFTAPAEHTPNNTPPQPGKPSDLIPKFTNSGEAIAAKLYGTKK